MILPAASAKTTASHPLHRRRGRPPRHLALEQAVPVRELCARRFKDFQFGLQLIHKNTGLQDFTIDVDAVDAPDKILSDWVVKSYRTAPNRPPNGAAEGVAALYERR